jgi:hypothetical protein
LLDNKKKQLELIHSQYYIIPKKATSFVAASLIAGAGAFGYSQFVKIGTHPGEIVSIDGESAIYDMTGNLHLIKNNKPEIRPEVKTEAKMEAKMEAILENNHDGGGHNE